MDKKDKISVKRIIQNTIFMIGYAAGYDRSLIVNIIVLYVISKAVKAVNDTFILKMIINGLTGKAEFKDIMVILLISFALVICFEWINQLIQEWSKAKLVKLSGTILRDLIKHIMTIPIIMICT